PADELIYIPRRSLEIMNVLCEERIAQTSIRNYSRARAGSLNDHSFPFEVSSTVAMYIQSAFGKRRQCNVERKFFKRLRRRWFRYRRLFTIKKAGFFCL